MYLGVNIMLWGIVLACHAACTTFAGLAVCRTLLGVFESCVAPILVLIIAMWYKKEEQGKRVSWFYVCNSLTAIFGGLLAYGVSFAKTKFASWRIFFVAIGVMTIFIGALVCIFLPDSPVKAKRFTDAEKVAALLRTKNNQSGTQNAHLKKEQVSTFPPLWYLFTNCRISRSSKPSKTFESGLSAYAPCLARSRTVESQTSLAFFLPHSGIHLSKRSSTLRLVGQSAWFAF
jgi:MFS transporter, ACS family, allantoate permease